MASRRSHTKSRNGCVQCKARRIKCNEQSPQCANCQRRQITCEYAVRPASRRARTASVSVPTSSPVQSPLPPPSVSVPPTAAPNGPSLSSFAGLDVLDLELLHHYTTSTYATLPSGAASDEHQLWQIQVVQLGFHHEFLLRGILAVAALHLAYLQNTKPRRDSSGGSGRPRRETLFLRASAHQSIAVRLFYEALNHVEASNCTAIFAFSCIIVALTFATPKGATSASEDKNSNNYTASVPAEAGGVQKEILDWFYMVRGCNSVLQTQWPTLSRSFLAPLLKRGMMHETAASQEVRDTAAHAHVTDLLGLCSGSDRTRSSASISTPTSPSQDRGNSRDRDRQAASGLALAVHELLNAYTQVSILTDRQQNFVPVIFVWPIAIPQSYLGLLGERRPEAMIILAHYAALLQRVDDQWYMRGWGQYLVQQIDAALGQEWKSWLEWPKQVTGIEASN